MNILFQGLWKNMELLFWVTALVLLGVFTNPYSSEGHFSLCLFKFMGFERCSGCGIGHAISFLLQGDLKASWNAHFMGIPAVLIIGYRIFSLSRKNFFPKRAN
jgi:hypothetical protein